MKKVMMFTLLVIILIASFSNTALPESGNTPEEKLYYGITLLNRYLTRGGTDELLSLDEIISQFDSVRYYGQARGFTMYTEYLRCVEMTNYDEAKTWEMMLQMNTEFKEYIATEEFTAQYVGICSVEQLVEYCHAREFEYNGSLQEAMTIYAANLNVYDSMDRFFDISRKIGSTTEKTYPPTAYIAQTPTPRPDSNNSMGAVFNMVQAGDYIYYGTYEQDNDTSNGPESIEWLVLAKENNRLLVISRYALDCQPFNTTRKNVTWETCTLRTWLNNNFYNIAFTDNEKSLIPTVTVSTEMNSSYNTNSGNITYDKVFLLSITEAYNYFDNSSARKCLATSFADSRGAYTKSDGRSCWWLRSTGYDQNNAAYNSNDGGVREGGYYVNNTTYTVRPVMWLDIGQ